MSGLLRYQRPDERLRGGATGDVDATYQAAWLVDHRTGYPALKTGSGAEWDITGTAQDVDLLVIGHHLLDGGLSVGISGDLTDTVVVPAHDVNGIPFNAYKRITSVPSVADVTLTITGNTAPAVIIGEAVIGKTRTLPITLARHTGRRRHIFAAERPIDRAWIPPYDKGMVAEQWTGTHLLTPAEAAELLAWEASQLSRTRPSVVIIENTDALAAPLCLFGFIEVGNQVPVGMLWKIDVRFVELPRTRW